MNFFRAVWGVVAAAAFTCAAMGGQYRVDLTGQISLIEGGGSVWDDSVAPTTTFQASFVFDTAVEPGISYDGLLFPIPNYFLMTGGQGSLSFGHYQASGGHYLLGILDDFDGEIGEGAEETSSGLDGYAFATLPAGGTWTHNLPLDQFYFVAALTSPDTTLLSSADQPVQVFPIDSFVQPMFMLLGSATIDGEQVFTILAGEITGYTVSAIPEPSTWALAAGLLALGVCVWRRWRAVAGSREKGAGSQIGER